VAAQNARGPTGGDGLGPHGGASRGDGREVLRPSEARVLVRHGKKNPFLFPNPPFWERPTPSSLTLLGAGAGHPRRRARGLAAHVPMASPRTFAALARASSAIDRLDTPATFGGLRVPTCAASPTTVSPLSRGAPPSRASNARTLARDLAILAPILERASASSARAPPAAPRTRSPPARSPVPARHHERRERDASRLAARAAERLRDAIERASRATPTAPARDPAPIPILSPLVAERCGGDARPRGEPPDADADSRARPRGVKKKALAAHLLPVVVFDASGSARRPRRGAWSRSSRFRGVALYKRTGRWEAHIWARGKQRHLGSFPDALGAARAHDRAALRFREAKKRELNFPAEEYEADAAFVDANETLEDDAFVAWLRAQGKRATDAESKGGARRV